MNYISKAQKVLNVAETAKEFTENMQGGFKGNLKNAINVTTLVPADPMTKLIVFLVVLLLPAILFILLLMGFCIVLFGAVVAIIVVKDIPITGGTSTSTTSSSTTDSNSSSSTSASGDTSVAKGMEGKLLLPKGMWNITDCYKCRSGGTHFGLDLQYTAASIAAGYDDWGVYPAYPGTVYKVGSHNSFGNYVFLEHDMGGGKKLFTLYGHMMKTNVKQGQKVGYDTYLGKIGNTGLVSLGHQKYGQWCEYGCHVHLHIEVHTSEFVGVMNRNTHRTPGDYITCGDGKTLGNQRRNVSECGKFRDKAVKSR